MHIRSAIIFSACLAFAPVPGAAVAGPEQSVRIRHKPPPLPRPDRAGYVTSHGANIHYAVFGHGPPVILLHGGLGSSAAWGFQIPVLAENYQTIAIDTRGHGLSSRPHGRLNYDDFAKDVLAVMNALAVPRAAVVGWSDGAIVGLDLAIHTPERITGLFAFAANVDPSGLAQPIDLASLGNGDGDDDDLDSAITRLWATQPHFTADQLSAIHVPTEIVAGERDKVIRRTHTQMIAARIPGAHLIILPGVGHRGLWSDPARFNAELIAFLADIFPDPAISDGPVAEDRRMPAPGPAMPVELAQTPVKTAAVHHGRGETEIPPATVN